MAERMDIPQDLRLDSYDFELPAGQIAQFPPADRGASRLLVLEQKPGSAPIDASFTMLASLLPPRSLLIANNSRVIHARLKGKRPGGGKVEFLLLTPLPMLSASGQAAKVEGLIRPQAKIRRGDLLDFGPVRLRIEDLGDFGKCQAEMEWRGELEKTLEQTGYLPLPPYIKREPGQLDDKRYQTIYASASGSIAAPTAGLHFTPEIVASLRNAGHEWAEITLHTGYGTFSPVRCADIRQHKMHSEYVELKVETAAAISRAQAEGRPVIAIGTTSVRALEGIIEQTGRPEAWSGLINTFIYPGRRFRIVDGLLTNFHLPRSSLIMLVSALTGRERLLSAYAGAVQAGYRFFSYGDAMLIKP